MEDNITKIKDRLSVVDVIAEYLKLHKAGVNYKARCPFHNEKSASFVVSPERQIWHCFGCSKGGDIFGFIKEIEGVEFPDALRILAAKAGIELTALREVDHAIQDSKQHLYEISELATKFFEKQLWFSNGGKSVLAYLRDRGLTDDSMRAFRIGYAPDANNALSAFLSTTQYSRQDLVTSGVVGASDYGEIYDRFKERIMFPITDVAGKVIGFSGRIFEANSKVPVNTLAKYINTPQTPIYDKSRTLYGLDKARLSIKQQNKCLVVEGNVDVVLSHQAGATHAVASSGTALTDGHLRIIRRYTDSLDLCFDSDNAGHIATDRGVELALAHGFTIGIVTIDESGIKDAADYVRAHGNQWAEYALSRSRPFMKFYIETVAHAHDINTEVGKQAIYAKIMPLIKAIPNLVQQRHWINQLVPLVKVPEEDLLKELDKVRAVTDMGVSRSSLPSGILPKASLPGHGLDLLEENIISIILKEPKLLEKFAIPPEIISLAAMQIITSLESSQGSLNPLQEAFRGDMSFEIAYLKSQELWKDFTPDQLETELIQSLQSAAKRHLSSRLTELEFSIKTAEYDHDSELLTRLMSQCSDLIRDIRSIHTQTFYKTDPSYGHEETNHN